jgi:hypothetical protein
LRRKTGAAAEPGDFRIGALTKPTERHRKGVSPPTLQSLWKGCDLRMRLGGYVDR